MTITPTFWQAVGNLIRDSQSPYPSPGLQPARSEPRPPIPLLAATALDWSFRPMWVYHIVMRMSLWRANSWASTRNAPFRCNSETCVRRSAAASVIPIRGQQCYD